MQLNHSQSRRAHKMIYEIAELTGDDGKLGEAAFTIWCEEQSLSAEEAVERAKLSSKKPESTQK